MICGKNNLEKAFVRALCNMHFFVICLLLAVKTNE